MKREIIKKVNARKAREMPSSGTWRAAWRLKDLLSKRKILRKEAHFFWGLREKEIGARRHLFLTSMKH